MKVLMTGARGFLGRHLINGFRNHDLISLGRHQEDDILADITEDLPDLPFTDMVVHAAGMAHLIPSNKSDAESFHHINLNGTANLANKLSSLGALPNTFVFISTVAVYGLDTGFDTDENSPTLGTSPYATSKINAEKWLTTWGEKYQVNVVILRLPLIVGKNAPGNLGAMVKNIKRGTYARIGTGEARRSMVLATDIAELIPKLLGKSGIYNLTDGIHPSYAMLEDHISNIFGKKILAVPPSIASWMAKIGDLIPNAPFNSYRYYKLRQTLTFSHQKAVADLGWKPTPVLEGYIP